MSPPKPPTWRGPSISDCQVGGPPTAGFELQPPPLYLPHPTVSQKGSSEFWGDFLGCPLIVLTGGTFQRGRREQAFQGPLTHHI